MEQNDTHFLFIYEQTLIGTISGGENLWAQFKFDFI